MAIATSLSKEMAIEINHKKSDDKENDVEINSNNSKEINITLNKSECGTTSKSKNT